MTAVEIGRLNAASQAGRDLRDAIAAGEARDEAAERLAGEIEAILAAPASGAAAPGGEAAPTAEAALAAEGPPGGGAAPGRDDPDAVLAAVAGRLRLGELALAAGVAAGETGDRPPDATETLDRALAALDQTTRTLERPSGRERETVVSRDLAEAVETLRARFGGTLDAIAKGTADVVAGPCKSIAGRAPAQWRDAWDKVSKRLFLDNIGGRLLRLGMRAVATALDALLELVDATWLEKARDRLVALADRAGAVGAAPAMVGGMLGAEAAREEANRLLRENALDRARIDDASSALAALTDRFDSVIGKLALAQAAVAGILAVQGHLGLAIPWLPMALLGAELLIGAVALVLAIDYVDTTVTVGRVRGARLIVRDATTARTAA